MDIKDRIKSLRSLMLDRGLDAYIIPSSDPHQSEYVPERWKSRKWLSGFTGSAGTVVVTKDKAGLWTDGRYYIQAEKELEGTNIELFKAGQIGVPTHEDWLFSELNENSSIGFDGSVFSVTQIRDLEKKIASKNINLVGDFDLIDDIWKDRPNVPDSEVFIHDLSFTGKSVREKLEMVRKEMTKNNADYYLLTTLDDIAWLFNLRGNDVPNNPVFVSYALISMNNAWLFIDNKKAPDTVQKHLASSDVELKSYDGVFEALGSLSANSVIAIDAAKVSYKLYKSIDSRCKTVEIDNIVTNQKAVKNSVEVQNIRNCHIRDGAAMVKFLYWLDCNVGKMQIDEISAADRLEEFRAEQEHFMGTSFDTIAGYKDHAAMMHYKADAKSKYSLEKEGMFLVDSGGQYLDGTTDITRTIILGDISDEQRKDFTLVLKGMLALSKVKFLYGATGTNLDIIARQPLWEQGIDYKCGTGHGVGFMLSVHELPQRFGIPYNSTRLEESMIITNEPGIYKENRHGVRIENTLLVVEDEVNEFGRFMKFETISYCPIDIRGIDKSLLNAHEIDWVNNYHKEVYSKLSYLLNEDERQWLKKMTEAI